MQGPLVNAAAIIIGTLLGCLFKRGIPEKVKTVLMQALGLSVVIIGIMGAIKTAQPLLLILSLVLGGAIGRMIGIEDGLNKWGARIQRRFAGDGQSHIAEGFVTSTLIFCVGAMAVVGSLESGIQGNHQTLYIKSMLDGTASVVLASTLGWGVALSAIPILIYQGGIALAASALQPFLTDSMVLEMSAVGGVLILGIGINLLDIKKIHVGDLLPAILGPVLYYLFIMLTGR